MPDHWHGLVELGEGENLSSSMHRFKAATSTQSEPTLRTRRTIWARVFTTMHCAAMTPLAQTARYIIANPLRARLVKDPMDYPYWDAYFIGNHDSESAQPLHRD